MPNRHKPTKVLELSGAFAKNPSRRRTGTVTDSRPVGDAPEHLTDEVKEMWRELVQEAPAGLLAQSDRVTLEVTANLLVEFREQGADMKTMRLNLLVRLLGMIGCNPQTRASMDLPATPEPENNPFLSED